MGKTFKDKGALRREARSQKKQDRWFKKSKKRKERSDWKKGIRY